MAALITERVPTVGGPEPGRPPGEASNLLLAAEPTAATRARRHAADVLRRWQAPEVTDTCVLLVSELVTNAIKAVGDAVPSACRREPRKRQIQTIRLRLQMRDRVIVIKVWDGDSRLPVLAEGGIDDDGGRGLQLVAALSDSWGYYASPTGGKVIWCAVNAQEPAVTLRRAHSASR